jgi:hypothetical protein
MRHEPDDVAPRRADAGDVVGRTVGVVDVADHNTVLGAQLRERLGRAGVVALEVVDRDAEHRTDRRPDVSTESTVSTRISAGPHRNLSPAFFWSAPGQQVRLGEHLEAVADADDRPTVGGVSRRTP